MTTKIKNDKATAIFNAIKTAVNLNNVELRNAAVQDALVRFEFEHAALVAVAETAKFLRLAETSQDKSNIQHWRAVTDDALAKLAAVREGGAK
jgi:hypothetical protein